MFSFRLGARVGNLRFLGFITMSKNDEKVYYAVGRGREIGIYDSWKDCKVQIEGVTNAKFRKFFSLEEAEEFINFWKNYTSPCKATTQSVDAVSKYSKKDRLYKKKENKKKDWNWGKKVSLKAPLFKNGFVLGRDCCENVVCGSEKNYLVPYVSPINNFVKNNLAYCKSFQNERNSKADNFIVDSRSTSGYKKKNSRKKKILSVCNNNSSVNSVDSLVSTFKFVAPTYNSEEKKTSNSSPNAQSLVRSNIFLSHESDRPPSQSIFSTVTPENENISIKQEPTIIFPQDVGEIAQKEVNVEIMDESSECSENVLEISDKLTKCLQMIKTIFKDLPNLNRADSGVLTDTVKIALGQIITNINSSINPQIQHEENEVCEDSTIHVNDESEEPQMNTQMLSTPSKSQQHLTVQTPQKSPITSHSTSFEGMVDQKDVNILALNMRLDSFEKRFDACLKEVGAIVSEMSTLKSAIKEIKDTLSSTSSGSRSGYNSPRKNKEGLLQTTLNFGCGYSNKGTYSPSRNYSSKGNNESGEPEVKRGRTMKRKLSRSNSDGDDVDFTAKVKMESVDYTSFTVDADDYVEVYTDGACQLNGQNDAKAGIGIWFGDGHPLNVAEPLDGSATNNSAEIQAARVAVELAVAAGISKLKIFTDSEFLLNCVTKWMRRWKKNGWTLVNGGQVKNRKELEKLDKVMSKISVRWEKVAGHTGIKGNEMADRLANEGAAKYKR